MITVFAARKIALVSMISDIQFQLDLLSQKRMNLTSVGMIIADGQVAPDEIQGSNFYTQNGIASVLSFGQNMTQQSAMMGQPMMMVSRNPYNPSIISIHDKAVEASKAQLAAQEKTLDLQIRRLETKLSMFEKDLDAVQEGEKKSVERATPKYTGVA